MVSDTVENEDSETGMAKQQEVLMPNQKVSVPFLKI